MTALPNGRSIARIANVSAALIVPIGTHTRNRIKLMLETSKLLERLFEDVIVVGAALGPTEALGATTRILERDHTANSALTDLVLAFEAAREERLLVVAADTGIATAELLLGLTAWPEHDCVVPRVNGVVQPLCALYRCDAALVVLRESLERGEADLSSFARQFDCGILEGDDLTSLLSASASLS